MDMKFGLWNIRSLYRARSVMTVSRELSRAGSVMTVSRELSKLDLVGVQEFRWEGGGTEPEGEYTFFFYYGKGCESHEIGTGFFVHKRITSAVRRVEFISDRMSYIMLRGR
jgi:hypothetical protein